MSKVNEDRAPWNPAGEGTPSDRKRYRVKVFKSGNSVALRLPAELGLRPGTEMELTAGHGSSFTFEPAERPKRKLNVDKFWGKAPGLRPLTAEDRIFEPSNRPWDDPEWAGWPKDPA